MSPQESAETLGQLLAEEAGAIALFVELLKREQAQLSQGQTDELSALAEQKSTLAARLQRLAGLRSDWLASLGYFADRAGIETWLQQHPQETPVAASWAAIMTQAAEARELNRLNGELIELHLQHNARALNALRGGEDSLDLVGPDGQSRTSGSTRINASA